MITTNWAFIDSLRSNYFTGVRGQRNKDAIDITDCTQENSPYNCNCHKRDVTRAPDNMIS
jgi:hypothetical protein